MSTFVSTDTAAVAHHDPAVSPLGRMVLDVLAGDNPPVTLDRLAYRLSSRYGRAAVFATVAVLEERGWLVPGVIR